MSGGLIPNSQTFLGWNKLMIDMSNIFFLPLQQFIQKKSKMSTTKKCLHSERTTQYWWIKKNCNIHVFVSWFAFCLHVHMHFLTWILWGYYSQPTQLINLILELEICLFRINKKIAFWTTSALYILDILFRLIGII